MAGTEWRKSANVKPQQRALAINQGLNRHERRELAALMRMASPSEVHAARRDDLLEIHWDVRGMYQPRRQAA